jgi:hypothetical protein
VRSVVDTIDPERVEAKVLSSIFPLASMSRSVGAAGNKVAKLAALNQQLSACEEELKTVAKQCSSVASKESDQKALSTKITALKTQIAELSVADEPASSAVEPGDAMQGGRAQRAEKPPERPSFDLTRLDLAKEGDLGTRINLLA